MKIHFYKYHGAGNDFILIDNRVEKLGNLSAENIRFLCDRHFGIGADGLMILHSHPKYHFRMEYFNSDGSGGTMCGNGGRCIAAFARKQGNVPEELLFEASDGLHQAVFEKNGDISLKMAAVDSIDKLENAYFCNTGSPHHIIFAENVNDIDVFAEGRKIRYSERYKESGTNVDFVQTDGDSLFVRTYERGVENETLSCGTGVTASALVFAQNRNLHSGTLKIETLGGNLSVSFKKSENGFKDIWLTGAAEFVFEGDIL
jgi:diaminopimelate epimerase